MFVVNYCPTFEYSPVPEWYKKLSLAEAENKESDSLFPTEIDLRNISYMQVTDFIQRAVLEGKVKIVKHILEARVPFSTIFGKKLVRMALATGRIEILKLLHNSTQGLNILGDDEFFPLHEMLSELCYPIFKKYQLSDNQLLSILQLYHSLGHDFSVKNWMEERNLAEEAAYQNHTQMLRCLVTIGLCTKHSFSQNAFSVIKRAVIDRDLVESVKILHGLGISFSRKEDPSLFHDLIDSGKPGILTFFLEENVIKLTQKELTQSDYPDYGGDQKTLTHYLVEKGYLSIIEVLHRFGLDLDIRDENGMTAAHWLVKNPPDHWFSTLAFLYEMGADLSLKCSIMAKYTSSKSCQILEDAETIRARYAQYSEDEKSNKEINIFELYSAVSNPSYCDYVKKMVFSIDQERLGIIRSTLRNSVHCWPENLSDIVNDYLSTPLQGQASLCNFIPNAAVLENIIKRALFNKRLFSDDTIDKQAIKTVLRTGINLGTMIFQESVGQLTDDSFCTNAKGRTPATYPLIFFSSNVSLMVLTYLHSLQIDLTQRDGKGDTLSYLAGQRLPNEVLSFLLTIGHDLSEAALGAIDNRNLDTFRYLISHGVNTIIPTRTSAGMAPSANTLHFAAGSPCSSEFLALLFTQTNDRNPRDSAGNTPLHLAVKTDNADMITFLAENGADLFARNNMGVTPVEYYCTIRTSWFDMNILELFYKMSCIISYDPFKDTSIREEEEKNKKHRDYIQMLSRVDKQRYEHIERGLVIHPKWPVVLSLLVASYLKIP